MNEAYQVVIRPDIQPAFEAFLKSLNVGLTQIIEADEDTGQLAVFIISEEE